MTFLWLFKTTETNWDVYKSTFPLRLSLSKNPDFLPVLHHKQIKTNGDLQIWSSLYCKWLRGWAEVQMMPIPNAVLYKAVIYISAIFPQGMYIKSTYDGLHVITGTTEGVSANVFLLTFAEFHLTVRSLFILYLNQSCF